VWFDLQDVYSPTLLKFMEIKQSRGNMLSDIALDVSCLHPCNTSNKDAFLCPFASDTHKKNVRMCLSILQRQGRIFLTAWACHAWLERRERKRFHLCGYEWPAHGSFLHLRKKKKRSCSPNGRANGFAQTHSWCIFGPHLRRCCERFASSRWSAFFIRADANGRKMFVCVTPLEMP
jgi:hypothetical protein